MPKGTRVSRCVDKVKKSKDEGAAIAICQDSTKQGYATGKKLKESIAHTGYKRIGIALAETMGLVDEGIYRNWQKKRWTKKTNIAKSNLDTLQTAKEDPRTVGTTKHPRQRHIDNATNKLGKTAKKLYHHLRKDGADHNRAVQIMRHSTGGSPDPDWNPDADEEARNDKFKAKGVKAGKDIAKKIKQEVANEQEEPLMKWKNKVLELVIEGNKKSKALGQEAGKDLAIARGIDITTEEGLRKYKKLRAKALKNIVQGHQEVHGTRQQDKVS